MKALTKNQIRELIETDNNNEFLAYFKEKDAEIRSILNHESEVYKLFNMNLRSVVDAKGIKVDNFKNAEEMLNMVVDFVKIFNVEPNKEFQNDLFKGYILKISNSNKLVILREYEYAYISKNIGLIDKLTPVRLYMLINNYTNLEMAVEKMSDELGVTIDGPEMLMKINERLKYGDNILTLDNLDRYNNLYRIVKDNLFILQQIQIFGLNVTNKIHKTIKVNDRDMIPFFLTSSYIHKNLEIIAEQIIEKEEGKKIRIASEGHIRRVMVLFQNLGLLQKVEVDDDFYNCIDKTNIHYKKIKFYVVPKYSHNVLKEADKRAKKLMEHDIFAGNITNKKCQEILFGKEEDKESKEKEYLDLENLNIDFTI